MKLVLTALAVEILVARLFTNSWAWAVAITLLYCLCVYVFMSAKVSLTKKQDKNKNKRRSENTIMGNFINGSKENQLYNSMHI